MDLAIGIILALVIIGFTVYSSICIKHAARFRYLSSRTVYLSLTYVALSTILIMLLIGTYIWYISI